MIPHDLEALVPNDSTAAPERLLRAKEVADQLSVHVSTVYRLADSGRLRSHRIGEGRLRKRGLRIPESAVADLLTDTDSQPTSEVA